MAQLSDDEVAKNSGTVEVAPDSATAAEPVQDQTPGPDENEPRTPAPDTTPPGKDGETKDDEKPADKPAKSAPKAKHSAPKAAPAEKKEEPKKPAARKPHAQKEWTYQPPTPSLTTRIQRALGRHGFYYGPADGKFEEKSIQGVQRAIATVGYEGAVNGHIGEEQARLIQVFAKKEGNYTGPLNKKIDENTWAGFAVALERLP